MNRSNFAIFFALHFSPKSTELLGNFKDVFDVLYELARVSLQLIFRVRKMKSKCSLLHEMLNSQIDLPKYLPLR